MDIATMSSGSVLSCNSISLHLPNFSAIHHKKHLYLSVSPPFPSQRSCNVRASESDRRCWSNGVATLLGKPSLALLISATLCFADSAQAFKGGGPYGVDVTRGQDLSGKDFSGKNLTKQDFKTSILRQANFKGANLIGASFFDADLTGADLSDADLRAADLSLAKITKADLTNANLEGAQVTGNTSFKGSKITGADFTDVSLRDDQRRYLCGIADGVNKTTGNATRETLLC